MDHEWRKVDSMPVKRMGEATLGDLVEPLLSAYLAYIPWLLFAIGLVFIFVGTVTVQKHRRMLMVGLWMAAVSALWIMLRVLYPTA